VQIDMSRFREAFFDEAAEHLGTLESGLLRLESAPEDPELLSEIFRAAHSIKGGSATFGLEAVAHFTHSLESVLDRLRDRRLQATPDLVRLLLEAADRLKGLLGDAQRGTAADADEMPLPRGLDAYLQADASAGCEHPASGTTQHAAQPGVHPASVKTADFDVQFVPGRDLFRQGMDPLLLLRDLGRLGTVLDAQADTNALPPLEALDPESCYLSWRVRLRTDKTMERLREVFLFVEGDCDLAITRVPVEAPITSLTDDRRSGRDRRAGGDRRGAALESASIRVDTRKVDTLIDLVGELVISQSMLDQALRTLSTDKPPALVAAAAELDRNMRDLQERVMAIRMIPLGAVFSRFPRLVHDLAAGFGKKVRLSISGAETELDKAVVEQLSDPLTHLIRNSIDHGLEPAEDRAHHGKDEEGTVHLRAYHESGSVVVEVADDGRGLDTARIREKAIELGWAAAADQLTAAQWHDFIFRPGFSTASTVSGVSGRGVGMDVVRQNVQAMSGAVSISTEAGRGTCFRIRLPLTLAILDGLQLAVGDHTYILPLTAIIESIRPRREQLSRILGQGEVITVRGETLPLVRLHRIVGLVPQYDDPSEGLVVLVETDRRRFGLFVDALLGQSQVVIKSLEVNYRKVDGITAATILGDGRVALILDPEGLVRLAMHERIEPVGVPPAAVPLVA
jgi:two-component system, chemotaxis family, sensor kinase CheA